MNQQGPSDVSVIILVLITDKINSLQLNPDERLDAEYMGKRELANYYDLL